jgi:L-Ala-D/L-Glu epimerase
MKLDKLSIHCLNIPFVEGFGHATKDRRFSDAIVVEIHALGQRGYGEALPRDYVTGETTESVVEHLQTRVWPQLAGRSLDGSNTATLLPDITRLLDEDGLGFRASTTVSSILGHNAARCALELALLDCWLKAHASSFAEVLPAQRPEVTYSGVISTGNVERATALARKMRLGGLTHIKVKVGDALDIQRVAAVREAMGDDCSLRVDANGAWDLEAAVTKLGKLAPYRIDSCEEPLGRERRAYLPQLLRATDVPIVVDESLVTEADAFELLATRSCHGFNLRLSKLGGFGPCLRFAQLAAEAGIWCQLGSHVGETSILAAAGRHLALHLPEIRFAEGSFGSLLLSQDIASPSVKFGHGGRGKAVRGMGLGAQVLEERLRQYSVHSLELA